MNKKIILFSILASLAQTASASDSQTEIELLRQQIKLLTERLDKFESHAKEQAAKSEAVSKELVATSNGASKNKSIADRLSFKADFRQRFESIDQQGKVMRDRNRVRLRAALSMKVDESLSFTLGTATGGDDPVSTNQTFDDAFSTKDVRLDLAYFDYKFSDVFELSGGKMKNPFYKPGKNSAFWDSDLNPEGLAFKFNNGFFNGSLVGFSIEERKADGDSYLLGGQVMHGFKLSDNAKITAGLGYYDYSNLQGNEALFDNKPRGNSVDANGNYANDYNIIEAFVEYKNKIMGKPFSFYGNYFQNTAAKAFDAAYTFGFKYGKIKGAGTWDIGLAYLDIEADSVVGLFNDSDFAGGNTDSKGLSLKAGYGIRENMALGLTYIMSEFGQSLPTQTDYDRLQFDLKLKFK